MRKFIFTTILLIPFVNVNPQEIGKLVEEKEPITFPNNALGVDVMFGEGGLGIGGFYRRQLDDSFTFFTDVSFSEAKDDKEIEYYDPWGYPLGVIGKKNRVFLLPFNAGIQYRLFKEVIYDNLRPYINFGIGPTVVVTTPYAKEFFSAFGDAKAHYAAGGYIGIGANFGIDKSSLVGMNLRYYIIYFLNDGVESMYGRYRDKLTGFYLTINFGVMY